MNNSSCLRNNNKKYLCCFYEILDCMIERMTDAQLTDSISHNFIVQMIPHHRAAIEMSENILKYAPCKPLKNIAENIISEQTKSIEDMRDILCRCSEFQNSEQDLHLYRKAFSQITQTMFSEMRNARTPNNINADFMYEMIPHHKGAIKMSENALQYKICPQLIPVLRAIITSQSRGVQKMECLLNSINY